MSALPSNLEASGFHRGQYVAYGLGAVWRVKRREGGGWIANRQADGRDTGLGFRFGRTLEAVAKAVQS